MDFQAVLDTIVSWCTNTGIKVLIAIILLIVAFAIINGVSKKLLKRAEKSKKMDKTVSKALFYVGKIGAKILVVLALVGYLGIDTSGVTALIASLGVAAGLAINGTLSNLAGGVLLLITRPFKDDDYISACGYEGTVLDIRITYTKLRTVDNKVVYIPNGGLSTSSIVNFSEEDLRRVDLTFSVAYDTDFAKAEKIILDVASAHELVLQDPAPFARIVNHGQSAIEIVSRSWTKGSDYWTVYFDLLEGVKKAFDENGIVIPFNQIDVHMIQN